MTGKDVSVRSAEEDGGQGEMVDRDRLRSLFRKFEAIVRLSPWKWLQPHDYFGIMPAGCVEPVFFHFNHAGEEDELVLAFGWDASAALRLAAAGALDHAVMRLYEQPLVRCHVRDVAKMSSAEKAFLDQAAFPPDGNGRAPVFICHRPGWLPWMLQGPDVVLCETLLDQALGVLLRAESDPSLVKRTGPAEVWVRACDEEGVWHEEWLRLEPYRPLSPGPDSMAPEDLIRRVDSLPIGPESVELDLDILPHFPFLKPEELAKFKNGLVPLSYFLAMCDAGPDIRPDKSCIANCIIYSGGDIPRMWNAMAESVLEFFLEAGRRPREIAVSSRRMMDFLRPLQTKIRFKLTFHRSLPNYEAVLAHSSSMIQRTLAEREAEKALARQENP